MHPTQKRNEINMFQFHCIPKILAKFISTTLYRFPTNEMAISIHTHSK